jgi:hypothetical protein
MNNKTLKNSFVEIWKSLRVFLAVFIIALIVAAESYGKPLPENIKKGILDNLGFFAPVYAQILESDLSWGGGYRTEDDLWGMGFLIPNGYLVKVKTGYVITEKLRPRITVKNAWPSNWLLFPAAKRILKSIDYTNNWREGVQEFWSFKFTYVFEPALPELPRLGPFKGIGIGVWHPATGEWQLYHGSSLGDRGSFEYNDWVNKQRQEYKQKLEVERLQAKQQQEAEMRKTASEKYRDNGDGTVTDIANKLTWTQKPFPYLKWELDKWDFGQTSAADVCSKLQLGSCNNWRLPTRAELETIIDEQKRILIDTPENKYFGSVEKGARSIWTSDITGTIGGIGGAKKIWTWSPASGWHEGGAWQSTQALCVCKGE